ncbi:uncharacterized protein LOC134072238 isoform X3 [Sardina pilchardus]|uniref:uncharacterized protein LOC134072238 isoform X3 n=1 Tax=Sardina pilchardus TaxID=27697 RepID=UPI002E135173
MDDPLAGSEPHGKLPGGNSMDPALAHMEMAVAVSCPTRNENEPLDLAVLQRMLAESDARAKYWSTVTMDLMNTCTKVMQSADRDRQWFVLMVKQIEKTMGTTVHLQDDRKSHSQETHICCPSTSMVSEYKKTEADDERYGLRDLVEDCRSRLGSLEQMVRQFTEKVEIAHPPPAMTIGNKDKEVPFCHYFREESSSTQASLGTCLAVGTTIVSNTSILTPRQCKDAAVRVPEELIDGKMEGKENLHHSPGLLTKCEVMEANVSTLPSPDDQLISAAMLQAAATPGSSFEMTERGVLSDSQLCPTAVMQATSTPDSPLGPPAVPTCEQRCEMITETEDQENSEEGSQHAGGDIVENNVCKDLAVAESITPEVEEVAEATLMSSDVLLLTPTTQEHTDLIGTQADVLDGADDGLELLKSAAVHENMGDGTSEALQQLQPVDENMGDGTSEALQLLPDPEDLCSINLSIQLVCIIQF